MAASSRARVLAVVGTVLVLGTLSIGVSALRSRQQPRVITVDKIKDTLFVFRGGGGNTAVFVTDDGVVVVDAKSPAGASRFSTRSRS